MNGLAWLLLAYGATGATVWLVLIVPPVLMRRAPPITAITFLRVTFVVVVGWPWVATYMHRVLRTALSQTNQRNKQ